MELNEYGLVLAGGGAKGAYQIGALKAVKELGLLENIKAISGTSIGGINLSIVAGSTIENGYAAWKSFEGKDFLEFDKTGFDITKYGDGIFTRESLIKILKDNVDYNKISNSDIPLFVTVCYKDPDGEIKVRYSKLNGLSGDTIEKYLMATSAIPVVYDAVEMDGLLLFDGGYLDNTPVAPVYSEGMKNIIVISNDSNYNTKRADFPGANIIDIVPSSTLDMDYGIGTVDLDNTHEIYRLNLGYYDAKAILQAYLEDRPVPNLSGNQVVARGNMKVETADTSVRNNISKLESMLGKYGIDL